MDQQHSKEISMRQFMIRLCDLKWASIVAIGILAFCVSAAQSQDASRAVDALPGKTPDGPPHNAVDLYGDPLPRSAIARLGTIRYRHPGWNKRVAFADSDTIIVGTPGGELVKTFPGKPLEMRDVAISPDGRLLVGIGGEARIQVWDIMAGKPIGSRFVGHNEAPYEIEFTPDGKRLVSGDLTKGGFRRCRFHRMGNTW